MGLEKCSLGPLGGGLGPPGPMGAYSRKSFFFIPQLFWPGEVAETESFALDNPKPAEISHVRS